jgi:hypothetical protein
MWAQRADAWAYSADLPQHVKSAALLAGAHCHKDQALGDSGWPEVNYQLCRVPRIEGLIGHDRMTKPAGAEHCSSGGRGPTSADRQGQNTARVEMTQI